MACRLPQQLQHLLCPCRVAAHGEQTRGQTQTAAFPVSFFTEKKACELALQHRCNAGRHSEAIVNLGCRPRAKRIGLHLHQQRLFHCHDRLLKRRLRVLCASSSSDSHAGDDQNESTQIQSEALEASRPLDSSNHFGERLAKVCNVLASVFPVWVVLATGSAIARPQLFTWIKGNVMVAALALTMLGMGTTLSLEDLKGAVKMPKQLVAGVLLQYTVMPSLGVLVASLMGLPEYFSVGIILVACCPGGTASNIVTYLARGNVALSVLMTAASTVMAVVLTPMLTARLAGKYVPVSGAALFSSTLQVVLLPVVIGALANHYFPKAVRQVAVVAPLVAVVTVAAIVGSAVASSAHALQVAGADRLLLSVVLLHGGGFLGGYVLARVLKFDLPTSRTVAIEVGMQNSVLGVLLASQHFPNPLTAAPCALSSVTHSVLGSLLAACWRLQSASNKEEGVGAAGG